MTSLPEKPVIGIVGGVGSGKSTVAAALAELGCAVVDCDAIGHERLADGDVRDEIRRRWGDEVFDHEGQVDRDALAAVVFANADELAALGAIMHPRIRRRMMEQIDRARQDPSVAAIVVDGAVLFEAGCDALCTHLVFVDAPAAERQRRVREQRGWDVESWRRREKSQIPLDKKAESCDYTIGNSSSVSHLRERIRQLFNTLVHATDCP
jgi:dephospho-CoA kinase